MSIIDKIDDLIFKVSPQFQAGFAFMDENIFLICSILSFAMGLFVFYFLKPHPAEKHLDSYKKGQITRRMAVESVARTMYKREREGIPRVSKSRGLERRLKALRRRLNVETGFMEDLIKYMKTKARLDD